MKGQTNEILNSLSSAESQINEFENEIKHLKSIQEQSLQLGNENTILKEKIKFLLRNVKKIFKFKKKN